MEPSQIQVTAGPDEVDIAKESLALLDPGDDAYLSKLDTLAGALMSRFALSGNQEDLDEAVVRSRQVLDIAPPGDARLGALSNMGMVLSKRFMLRGDASDITEAVGYFEAALSSCPPDHSYYIQLVANLCSGLLKRHRSHGDITDLDQIVETCTFALSICFPENPGRDSLFNNLATALEQRFERKGNREDLDKALTYYQSCLNLRPAGHPLRFSILMNLADAMVARFEMDGLFQDLENALEYHTSALELRSPGQEGYISVLISLGMVSVRLFGVRGETDKLDMAIGYYQTAMVHSKVPNMEYSQLLDNYAAALQSRFTLFGQVEDLDRAIQFLTTSSSITPMTYSGRPGTLYTLGTVLFNRFNVTGNIADLDHSIENLVSALQLSGPGYQERHIMLSVYGQALSARFKAKSDMHDLDAAVSICKEALVLASPKELNYAATVANLSLVLYDSVFYRPRSTVELQTVIDYCDRALPSAPPAQQAFITLKIVRAQSFLLKALYEQQETDINTAIDIFRAIIAILPDGHAEQVPAQWHLGLALQTRFQFSAATQDLDESVALYRTAHRNCMRGDTNYAHVCMHLGNALRECFDYDHSDVLDEAIVLLAEAENILSTKPGHSGYLATLVNLGVALFMRFQARLNEEDLDAAIEYMTHAQALPAFGEAFPLPFSLATALSVRYDGYGDLDDLERSVRLFNIAMEQMPPKHIRRGGLCRNYGHALFKLGERCNRPKDIDAAIVLYKEALELLPRSNYDHPLTYIRLAEALHLRAKLLRSNSGLYDAINLLRGVMRTLPENAPMFRSVCHMAAELSISMYTLSESQAPSFMEDAFQYYEKAAGNGHFEGSSSIKAALEWAHDAEKHNHASALLAYQGCLGHLNQLLLSTASIKSRRAALLYKRWARQTGTLATDAAACAIARGELELAVELSEQGRGLLWSQLARSHTPLDDLRSTGDVGRELASNFERVSAELGRSTIMESEPTLKASRLTTEETAQRYKQLSVEFQDIVGRIRQQDGFESFLDRLSFQNLQRAAIDGPIILVNASRRRCDALIILHDSLPRLVPLPGTTLEDLTNLSGDMYQMLKATSRVGEERIRERELVVFLRTLWDTVVSPVVDELTGLISRGARIWWCPTSTLTTLPLHAAGPYRKGAMNLANIYVSSYTPTLGALIRARHRSSESKSISAPLGFVAIGQAKASSSAPELQTVDAELTLVKSLLPPSIPFSALSGDASTADAALKALRTHGWVHMACHGHPNVEQPFDSSFALGDRPVTVLDIVGGRTFTPDSVGNSSTDAVAPEFAFLSACHTTVGDRSAPDEVIHLAAAMQFAGFRSVIGTMWAVDDAMAQGMVEAFYTQLFSPNLGGGEGGVECTMAARALNRAGKSVDSRAVTIDQRIVFVHIGA